MKKYYAEIHRPSFSIEYEYKGLLRGDKTKVLRIKQAYSQKADTVVEVTEEMYISAVNREGLIVDGKKYQLITTREEFVYTSLTCNSQHLFLILYEIVEQPSVLVTQQEITKLNKTLEKEATLKSEIETAVSVENTEKEKEGRYSQRDKTFDYYLLIVGMFGFLILALLFIPLIMKGGM